MHEDPSQVQLYLEPNIHIGPVYRGRPPKRESTIWNLVQTRSLSMSQFFELHGLLEPGSFLPKETLPSREIGPFEESVFEDSFNSS